MRMPLLFALAGLAAPATAAPYRAVGTEPFWSLTIDGRITYDPATGRTISARTPAPQRTATGISYRTPFIAVDITRKRCSDGMSDKLYPDTVLIRVGLRKFSGCGGGINGAGPRPPEDGSGAPRLDGTRWTPLTIDNRPLFQMARAKVNFDRGSIAANVGCNNFGGRYRIDRGRLYADNLVGTMMACQPAVMAQDRAFTELLGQGAEIRMLPGDKLELRSRSHKATLVKAR
jgi:heat shock protein HslJ